VEPLYFDDPYAAISKEVAFNTQTSLITCWYDPLQDVYHIKIDHDGGTLTTTLAGAVREHPKMLEYAYEQFMLYLPHDGNSLIILRQLFNSMFKDFYGQEFSPTPAHYAKGGYVTNSTFFEQKTHGEMSYKDYMNQVEHYQKQAMLYQTPYFFDKSDTHKYKPEYKYNPAAELFASSDTSSELAGKSNYLPGVNEVVRHPVTGSRRTLARTIINLNDEYRWTREQIADWVEALDVDTTFKTVEDA
jgi:hypothetical protein